MLRFSVILPTYRRNQGGLLAKAIESVLAQKFTNFELIVVDDGSTDGSAETIRSFMNRDSRVSHIRFDKNVGLPAKTCATAFLQSTGEYIAWIFDDSTWDASYLEEMNEHIKQNRDTGIFYSKCEVIFPSGSRVLGLELDPKLILSGSNHIPNCATIVRRDIYYKLGWYDPRVVMVRVNDWDFLRRAITSGVKFSHLAKVLTKEYGVGLSDSLGNSYDVDLELVMTFANAERREELQPLHIPEFDAISIPEGLELSSELLTAYLRLLIEFAIVSKRDSLLDDISRSSCFSKLELPVKNPLQQIRWWALEATERYRKELMKRDQFIQKQQAYIDEQQVYIDRQQKCVEEMREEITRLKQVA
jgi:glycosyltransferase involved in cell wall biosynthesis